MTIQWATDLAQLRTVLGGAVRAGWEGGRNNFVGLEYQVHVALLQAVRARVDAEAPSALYFESLSDFTLADDRTWITCEVKQTLRPESLHKALGQLYAVYREVRKQVPEMLPRLRFRIAYRTGAEFDPGQAARTWASRESDDDAAAMVDLLDFEHEQDPLGELLWLLATTFRVKEPRKLVDRWVRLVFGDAAGRNQLTDVMDEELAAAVSADDLPFTVLAATDREPDETVRQDRGFLTGEQPTIAHLRNGYFARSQHLDELERLFWNWYEDTIADRMVADAGRVPMFWIEGPSGAGKSILLLQLLARLNQRLGVTVLSLRNDVSLLTDAVEFARGLGRDRKVVIGVDDPFVTDSDDWRLAIGKLSALRMRGQIDQLPVFVCCGPSDQLFRFEAQDGSEVALGRYVRSSPTKDDIDLLRAWYRERTGDDRELPAAEPKMLPAQLFFEWWKRDGISSFARKFRARVRSLGSPTLEFFVARVLALNRLYLGYPKLGLAGLAPELRDSLTTLEGDLHFELDGPGRPGYWLAHPHLSTILYDTWFPRSQFALVRTRHLRDMLVAFAKADADGLTHYGFLLALLPFLDPSLLDGDAPATGRISRQDAQDAVAAVFAVVGPRLAELAPRALAAWVRIEDAAPEAMSTWYPFWAAVSRLTTVDLGQQPGMMSLLLALLDTDRRDARDAVRAAVRNKPGWDGATTVLTRLLPALGADELADDILAVVATDPAEENRLALLIEAVRAPGRSPGLRTFARTLLAEEKLTSPQLGQLAAEMFGRSSADRQAVTEWLSREVRQENGPALVAAYAPRGPVQTMHDANRWLERFPDDPAAGELFARLLGWHKVKPDFLGLIRRHLNSLPTASDSPVVTRITALLAESPDHPAWTYLFDALPASELARPETVAMVREWLTSHTSSSGWSGPFSRLAKALPGPDQELFELAMRQLPRSDDSWPFIADAALLLGTPGEYHQLVTQAITWLGDHPDSEYGWGYLFRNLLRVADEEQADELIGRALPWLRDRPAARTWSYVWRVVAGTGRERDTVLGLADGWLHRHEIGWRHVFIDFWRISAERLTETQAVELFTYWLTAAAKADPSGIGSLWKALVDDGSFARLTRRPELRGLLLDWLRESPMDPLWWYVWLAVYDAEPTAQVLFDIAVTADVTQDRAYGLANRLDQLIRPSEDVRAVVIRALDGNPPGPSWPSLWQRLVKVEMTAELREIGMRYLGDFDADGFSSVWKVMWKTCVDEHERQVLEDIGVRWCQLRPQHERLGTVLSLLLAENPAPGHAETVRELGVAWLADQAASGHSKHRLRVAAALAVSPA